MKIDVVPGVAFVLATTALASSLVPRSAAPVAAPVLYARMTVAPNAVRVFAGDIVRFRVASAGRTPDEIGWSIIGPGAIDPNGTFVAPPNAEGSAVVVASARGSAAAAMLTIVAPPAPDERLALVSCYDGGAIDVRDGLTLSSVGMASTGGAAAGIAADASRRFAVLGSGERLATFDSRTAAASFSQGIAGARFSEVALLANGYAAATDNNAQDGRPGVRIFRIGSDRVPVLGGSAVAGETPEGLAVSRNGRTFYVTNVNGNTVMRFAFDGRGSAHMTGSAATGHRPFGVAVDDRRGLLFVADNDTPTVSGQASLPGLEIFALPALRRVARLTTGSSNALPLGVAVDSSANRAFVTNEGDGTIVAYSILPLRRIATLPAGRTPWLPTLDYARGRLFVPSATTDSFSVFDERTLRPIARAVSTCGYPTSIAIM